MWTALNIFTWLIWIIESSQHNSLKWSCYFRWIHIHWWNNIRHGFGEFMRKKWVDHHHSSRLIDTLLLFKACTSSIKWFLPEALKTKCVNEDEISSLIKLFQFNWLMHHMHVFHINWWLFIIIKSKYGKLNISSELLSLEYFVFSTIVNVMLFDASSQTISISKTEVTLIFLSFNLG